MAVRKERAPNDRTAIRKWMTPLPRHGKRAADRNARTAILTTNQNENERNPKPATVTARKTRMKTEWKSGRRNSPGQSRKSRKAEGDPRTSPPPLLPTLIQNLMDPQGVDVPEVAPQNRDRKRMSRSLPSGHPPLRRLRNTISRIWGRLMCTVRSGLNVQFRDGRKRHVRLVRASIFVTTEGLEPGRIVCITGNG